MLLIVLAIRYKVSVGLTLLVAGILTAVLYGVSLADLLSGYWSLLGSRKFLFLISVVILITILGRLLQELHYLDRLTGAAGYLPGGSRTAAAVMPPLIGLMPMPGGALLSAPLVAQVTKDRPYPQELRTATNYWFRHVAEFCWPIYPGLILTEAITGLPLYHVSLLQAPMTLIMIVIGAVAYLRHLDSARTGPVHLGRGLGGLLAAVWPIVLAIAVYGVFKIELSLAVLFAIGAVILVSRPRPALLWSAVKQGMSWKLMLLVFGTLSFQTVLELAGAIGSIPHLANQLHLPPELVIFLVCFVAGLLTGMVAAYVALGYTILAAYLYQPQIVPGYILLAYLGGYVGIMLSPTHLCLILTNEYFGSNLSLVYRRLALPILALTLAGFGLYWLGWGSWLV
ncbi:MAG: DUF401 family protein [bacterium]